jgi:hypothetical protein
LVAQVTAENLRGLRVRGLTCRGREAVKYRIRRELLVKWAWGAGFGNVLQSTSPTVTGPTFCSCPQRGSTLTQPYMPSARWTVTVQMTR